MDCTLADKQILRVTYSQKNLIEYGEIFLNKSLAPGTYKQFAFAMRKALF